MTERRKPLILDPETDRLPDAPLPGEAPPLAGAGTPSAAEQALRAAGRRRGGSLFRRLFWSALAGLVVLAAGLGVEAFLSDLFARHPWLGWFGAGLFAVIALGLLAVALIELAALARLARIERLRARARAALAGDRGALEATMTGLQRLYGARFGMAERFAGLASARDDTPDPAARLALAERALLGDLDHQAERAVARAARDVAAATALIPLTLVDVLAVLAVNLRMIRQVAEIYGGRAGVLGAVRLLRAVATHLLATGAVAATDELLGPMVGGGILGKLSRRFGEAAVNAALTARVGVAALEVCRPLPFSALERPPARRIVLGALKDWRPERAPA